MSVRLQIGSLMSAALTIYLAANCEPMPANAVAASSVRSMYFWSATPVGATARLNTLFCRGCDEASGGESDVPLISVLRDTLGDDAPENDRLTAVWLLTYSRPAVHQRVLSAIPFYYWHVPRGSGRDNSGTTAPLIDLTSLQNPMVNSIGRDLLQWTTLDPASMSVRALSRAYRMNETDDERLHLAEAISYLREAPVADPAAGLTAAELHTLMARLELRKSLLGGFVTEGAARKFGERAGMDYERIRSRNWELLRQCADKAGLYFEPINVAGTSGQYAMLWLPLDQSAAASGTKLGPIWRLLNLKNPYQKAGGQSTAPISYTRDFDADGNLLPKGVSGVTERKLVPLGVYSLDYPKIPLLLVDFRGQGHLRWHAITQRSINEVTAGVIGISHFTNWYYYVGMDLYNFIAARRGGAVNAADRLDCYSQFRVHLALDSQLDPELRRQLRARVDSLGINPLESNPQEAMQAAAERFGRLQTEAGNGQLATIVDKDRRAELASSNRSRGQLARDNTLHFLSIGTYSNRVKSGPDNVAQVDRLRRAQVQLRYLDQLAEQGTQPEVTVDAARISHSIAELQAVVPFSGSTMLRLHAAETIGRIRELSQDEALRSDCETAVASLRNLAPVESNHEALNPSAVHLPAALTPAVAASTLK